MLILPRAGARTKPRGLVLYEGPSRLDGGPIVAVATGLRRPSANGKTGNMVQTWILRADVNPLAAVHSGADASVCGDCPLRGVLEPLPKGKHGTVNRRRACYVAVHQAPLAVFRAYEHGAYEPFDPREHLQLFKGRRLRLGSYGDPVAAPHHVWASLCRVADG